MLTTNLPLHTVRTNAGTTAVVATLADGSTALVGESTALGKRRAMLDVLSAGSGSFIAKTLARLEARDSAIIECELSLPSLLNCDGIEGGCEHCLAAA